MNGSTTHQTHAPWLMSIQRCAPALVWCGVAAVAALVAFLVMREASRAAPVWLAAKALWAPWAVLWLGLLLAALFGTRLARPARRPDRLHGVIDAHTDELLAANAILRQEIDARQRVEMAPRDSARRYAELIERAPDPIITLDLLGCVQSVNRAAEQISGYAAAELVGKSFTQAGVLADAMVPKALQEFAGIIAHQHRPPFTLAMIRKDGSTFVVEVHAQLVTGDDALPVLQMLFRDCTERQRLVEALDARTANLLREQARLQQLVDELQASKAQVEAEHAQLQALNRQLEQSHAALQAAHHQLIQTERMESVGRLAAGVAQEIKRPLTILLLGAEYLSKHLAHDTEAVPVVQDMRDAAVCADEFVRSLLHVSTAKELLLTPGSLHLLIEQALAMVQPHIFHLTVVQELDARVPVLLLDRKKMQQVFVKLFLNAAAVMPTGGQLTVRTTLRRVTATEHDVPAIHPSLAVGETVVLVDIEDTSPGLSDGQIAQMLDPFGTTTPSGGVGVGLAVVKRFVEMHGGLLHLANRSPHGLRVTLLFKTSGS